MNAGFDELIDSTELPPSRPGDPFAAEWDTYRREVAGLLAGGHEGEYALIRGDRVLVVLGTLDEALTEWHRRAADHPIMLQQIHSREPLVRLGRGGAWLK